jgi:hypothetical protein
MCANVFDKMSAWKLYKPTPAVTGSGDQVADVSAGMESVV